MILRYPLLVFDWDGTLMDSEARIVACLNLAISALGLEARPHHMLSNIIGLGLNEAVLSLYPEADEALVQAFVEHYRNHFLSDQQLPSELFPGALDTLQQLHQQGYLLAVATGKSRRGLDRSLAETGSRDLFHATRCADETCSKPHPQMLLEIMAALDVIPEETLMIGDTEYDMLMANQAGAGAVAVDYGVHDRQRLLEQQPLGCLTDIRELPGWLNSTSG
jgi:phosphoglycolate phosphatase